MNYTKNITTVKVNDKKYAASGRGSVKLINSDGTLVTDADAFAEDGKYTVTVTSTGYQDITFEYEKKAAVTTPEDNTGNTGNAGNGSNTGTTGSGNTAGSTNNTGGANGGSGTGVTGSNNKPAGTTTVVSVAKVKGVKVTGKAKKVKVSWKKVSGAAGYQIQYSTSKKFKKAKSVTVKKAKTVKATIKKGVKNGKKYYVRVRAYKTVNGKKKNGKWSDVKTVKVKK